MSSSGQNEPDPVWSCPFCEQPLVFSQLERLWACSNRHSFDSAREGYVNLLPANKKHSSEPGDSAQMIAARRQIHTAEIYRPLAEAVQHAVSHVVESPERILDLGCGEGYYSNALQQACPTATVSAVDISRPAIRLAAKSYKNIQFAVASTFDLPVPAGSQNVVVRIFAPADDAEIVRVLKADGVYLEVTPAPKHLWSLRQALYEAPRTHAVSREQISGLRLCDGSDIEFAVTLENPMLQALVAMTPFAHRGQREKREQLLQCPSLDVTLAFTLRVFRKVESSSG